MGKHAYLIMAHNAEELLCRLLTCLDDERTDSGRIQKIAIKCGALCPFLKPDELASDEARTIDSVLYTINELASRGQKYDVLVVLQSTSPLRNVHDIDASIELFERKRQDVTAVCESRESPVLCRLIDENGIMKSFNGKQSTIRRQDMKTTYHVNGAIYINEISKLTEKTSFNDNPVPYIMPRNRSVDIDSYEDLDLARFYMEKNSS